MMAELPVITSRIVTVSGEVMTVTLLLSGLMSTEVPVSILMLVPGRDAITFSASMER